jgi:DNA repair protein SbcD/Mre11
MPRFLHLADVHLGFDRYDSKERTQDFFYAFHDALEKYAIAPQVDFVIIAGDLFEHRNIQPATLNQAQISLHALKKAGIPVLAIEGNHDNRPYGTKTSWLRYLASWDLLILLEPGDPAAGEPFYFPWDGKRGGYIDLDCGVRVLGSYWYGSTAPKAIEQIAEAMKALPPTPNPHVLMFHHGMEGQISRYQGALRYAEVLPLKEAGVDYLALGHIHKNYEVEGWIFNPGSTEANSVEESSFDRGVYSVEISTTGITAELKQDYQQRPIVRLKLTLRGTEEAEAVAAGAIALLQEAIQKRQIDPEAQPIVEMKIDGQLGFERLELNIRELQQQLQQISHALIFLLKFDAESITYATPFSDDASRLQIEQDVFMDLLTAHNTYKKRAPELAQGLIALKDLQMEGRSESEMYDFVQTLLAADET